MSEGLNLAIEDGLAIVELDNPPVNALFDAIRDGLVTMMAALDADPAVRAILIVGAGAAFCAGVDLKATAGRTGPYSFHAALDAMDKVGKPLAAAIHGPALGGGLEVALTCHYRLGGPKAKYGLPEVEVGVMPGAAGTQRLPRLIPIARAIEVAALGELLDTDEAKALGLIDAVADAGDFRARAKAWARTLFDTPVRRTRDLPVQAPAEIGPVFAAALARVEAEKPGEPGARNTLTALRAACEMPFDAGVAKEFRLAAICKSAPEGKAMRHLFFAERGAGKAGAPAGPMPPFTVDGSQAGRLGLVSSPGEPLHAVLAGEPSPDGEWAIIFPKTRAGVVEIATPKGADEAVIAALAKLVRGIGRATVIGRGARISARLAAAEALADEADRLVAEGTARSLGEVDLVAVTSLGLPRTSGGPTYMRGLA